MLPTASIRTRAFSVSIEGETTACEPSFGVLSASTVGKVAPPSVESRIRTFAAFIGEPAEPPTSQVTTGFEFRHHVVSVFGELTLNGAVPATTTCTLDVLS